MSAQVITIRPLMRPAYNNARIASYGLWMLDNAPALANYWTACGNALGLTDPNSLDEEEFDLWLKCQWDLAKRSIRESQHVA